MKFTIKANVNGVSRVMDAIVDSVSELDKVLARFGKYMRLKVQKAFQNQGPGWPALSEHSVQRNQGKNLVNLENKLKRDVKRAEKKAKKPGTVERRLSVLAEFRRLEAGGSLDKSLLTEKQQKSLLGRVERAKKDASEKMLGKVAASIKTSIKNGTLTVESKIPWAGVHNEGGPAGHGANIPKREFLALDEEDLDVLENFLLDAIDKEME